MPIRRRDTATILVAALGATRALRPAHAQGFPTRSLRIVVPTGAGGITDVLARILAAQMTERLGQPVVVDNRPGASGILGTEAVARAQPDGHTLLMAFPSHVVNPSLKLRLPYDTERDFAPITPVTLVSNLLVVAPATPALTVAELIALAGRQPLTYASAGSGSLGHLAGELFRSMAGIELTHVAYRSAPQVQTAVQRGEVTMSFDTPVTALPLVREGRLRALGVSTPRRSPVFPGVPTIAEAGLPGYEAVGWNGILAPAGTPPPVIDRLNAVIRAALAEPEVMRFLAEQGLDPAHALPDAFAARIVADIAKWARVVREAGIRPD